MATEKQTIAWIESARQLATRQRQVFADLRGIIADYNDMAVSPTDAQCPDGTVALDYSGFVAAFLTLDAHMATTYTDDVFAKISFPQKLR